MFPLPITPLFPVANIASTVIYAFTTSDLFGKSVVILLMGGSVFAWSIMIAKTREFRKARDDARRFLGAYRRESHPLSLYMQGRKYSGPLSAIYSQSCEAVLADVGARTHTSSDLFSGSTNALTNIKLSPFEINTARKLSERTAMDLGAILEEDMGLLATAVTAAPFLGLLGTVWGVMDAFKSMAASGTVMLSEVAPGISGALLTTVVGLLVALPSLVGYNLLTSQMRRICLSMDNFAEEFTNDLERTYITAS
jgi:biopolymer transport protein TolQ